MGKLSTSPLYRTNNIVDRLDLAIKLSKKLGWEDMLVHIALPAIDEILRNFSGSPEYLVTCDADDIFGLLGGCDISQSDLLTFCSLRNEIEQSMRKGMSHTDAINEWWK